MMHVVSQFLVLMGFWLLLSGQIDVSDSGNRYLMACGLLSCALVTYIAMRKEILDEEGHPVHLAFHLLAYFPWFFWQIILANIDVASRVWSPKPNIEPQMVTVPFRTHTDLGTMIYANSITLTPGTVTVSVDLEKREMLVHVLSESAVQSLLSGEMHDRVKNLEGLA